MSARTIVLVLTSLLGVACGSGCPAWRAARQITTPEAKRICYRAPETLPQAPQLDTPPPRTVAHPDNGVGEWRLSLDEAISVALANSEVIRVLTGVSAASTGQTIYDPGIANTAIDRARGRFDPVLSIDPTVNQSDSPFAAPGPFPPGATLEGQTAETYGVDASLTEQNALGGVGALRLGSTRSVLDPSAALLNPQTQYFTEMSYVQPLLQGAGIQANIAPVLVARIETERSFFQFKGAVQELVQSVVSGYWQLVAARTERWARQQQVDRAQFAFEREQARKIRGLGDAADVAQTRVTLTSFRANLVAAESSVLQREAALLNVLGRSPTEVGEVIPVTSPHVDRLDFSWGELLMLSETYRPDLIELKLILEADQQRIVTARNSAQPQIDAVALYRWDGINGRTPSGASLSSDGSQFTDWTLGVNFSVPLGLRQARADVRQQELLLVRDRAQLQQGRHAATHAVALSLRNLDQNFAQYEAFLEAREAAASNLLVQQAEFENGRAIFLNVLQALVDWGNAVSSESQSLTQFNAELANLELQTGTILEAHGIRFVEERFRFASPLSHHDDECYPAAMSPSTNAARFENLDRPSEEFFDLQPPSYQPRAVRPTVPAPELPPGELLQPPEAIPGQPSSFRRSPEPQARLLIPASASIPD